jgi:hypothetical protein
VSFHSYKLTSLLTSDSPKEIKTGLESKTGGVSKFLQDQEYEAVAKSRYCLTNKQIPGLSLAPGLSHLISPYNLASLTSSSEEVDRERVADVARKLCRIHFCCRDAFPMPRMKDEWAVGAWREAYAKFGVNLDSVIKPEPVSFIFTKIAYT